MAFCVIELRQAKDEPAWDDPLVIVPISFLQPSVKGCEKGLSCLLYPSMPHTLDDKEMIQDYVRRQLAPPQSWGVKECQMINVATTYELATQLLSATKAVRKAPKKRRVVQKKDPLKLEPTSKTLANKIRKQDKKKIAESQTACGPMIGQSQTSPNKVLADISNTENVEQQSPATPSIGTSEELNDYISDQRLSNDEMKELIFSIPPNILESSVGVSTASNIPLLDNSDQMSVSCSTNVEQVTGGPNNVSSDSIQVLNISLDAAVEDTSMNVPSGVQGSVCVEQVHMDLPSKGDHMNLSAVQKDRDIPHEVDESLSIEPINKNSSLEADGDVSYILVTKKDLLESEGRIVAEVSEAIKKELLESEGRIIAEVSEAIKKFIERKVNPRLDKIEVDQKELKAIVVEKSQTEEDIVTLDDFKDLYNLDLPFGKFEDFLTFDIQISKNARDIGSNLKKLIKTTSNYKVTPEENCKMTMRRFMKNDVISLFTAKNPSGNKPIFKNTAFFSCMFDSLLHVHNVDGKQILDEKILVSHVGTIINIARTTVSKTAVPKDANGIIETSAVPVAE